MDLGRLRSSTETYRQTTKWIITVFAGLASVLVAGLRFSDVGRLEPGSGPFWLAGAGAGIALLAVGYVLLAASKVLSSSYDTLRQVVAHAERAEAETPALPAELTDSMIRAIEREKDYLYGTIGANLTDLFDKLKENNDQQRRVVRGEIQLSAYEERRLRQNVRQFDAAVGRVVDFADLWRTKERFEILLKRLFICGAATAIGVFTFALAVNRQEAERATVARPTAVTVFLTPAGAQQIAKDLKCNQTTLQGVAVGGELTQPDVVIPRQGPCRAGRLGVTKDLGVAVPAVTTP